MSVKLMSRESILNDILADFWHHLHRTVCNMRWNQKDLYLSTDFIYDQKFLRQSESSFKRKLRE